MASKKPKARDKSSKPTMKIEPKPDQDLSEEELNRVHGGAAPRVTSAAPKTTGELSPRINWVDPPEPSLPT